MARRLVLFDIDGTLIASAGAGRRALVSAMSHLLSPEAFEQVRFDGKTDPQIVAELLAVSGDSDPHDAERINRVLENYLTHLDRELAEPVVPPRMMPGIPELLDALEAEPGVILGLLTGNVSGGASLKLLAAGIDPRRFKVGAFGSDSASRSELPPIAAGRAAGIMGRRPSGGEVLIIGDTPADLTCGSGIGALAIGVATGSYSYEELAGYNPWRLYSDLSETSRVMEAILSWN